MKYFKEYNLTFSGFGCDEAKYYYDDSEKESAVPLQFPYEPLRVPFVPEDRKYNDTKLIDKENVK